MIFKLTLSVLRKRTLRIRERYLVGNILLKETKQYNFFYFIQNTPANVFNIVASGDQNRGFIGIKTLPRIVNYDHKVFTRLDIGAHTGYNSSTLMV